MKALGIVVLLAGLVAAGFFGYQYLQETRRMPVDAFVETGSQIIRGATESAIDTTTEVLGGVVDGVREIVDQGASGIIDGARNAASSAIGTIKNLFGGN